MDILAKLESGVLHKSARECHPDRVDSLGNIHVSADRARFVEWRREMEAAYGAVADWPDDMRAEYAARYVASH